MPTEKDWYTCDHCGRLACYREHHEHWKNKCFFCWKESENLEPTNGDLYALRLEGEIASMDQQIQRQTVKIRQQAGELMLAKKALFEKMSGKKNGSGFSQDEIREMIKLCHPDRHGNSDISNEITIKLLDMRRG